MDQESQVFPPESVTVPPRLKLPCPPRPYLHLNGPLVVAVPLDELEQVPPGQELHDQDKLPLDRGDDPVDTNDVGATQPPHVLNLHQKGGLLFSGACIVIPVHDKHLGYKQIR